MATQELKDNRGFLIGKIEESNGKLTLKDSRGFLKGHYDPRTNTTTNEKGHAVGKGNLLALLLR